MNYETASDFERNKRLAELLGRYVGPVGDWMPNGVNVRLEDLDFCYSEVDFCKDWNAVMPLSVEHGIFYTRDTCQVHVKSYFDDSISVSLSPRYLIVAIVICLIKVLEVNDGKK